MTAVSDVASMIIHAEVVRKIEGSRDDMPDERYCAIVRGVIYSRMATAKEAWAAGHPNHGGACTCRHESLVIVNASQEARISGANYTDLVRRDLRNLHNFLKGRN